MKYSYYARVIRDTDGINIDFPDLPGCISCAYSESEIVNMAKEALSLYLEDADITSLQSPREYVSNENKEYRLISVEL